MGGDPLTRRQVLKCLVTAAAGTATATQDLSTGSKARLTAGTTDRTEGSHTVSSPVIDASTLREVGTGSGDQVRLSATDRDAVFSSVLATVPRGIEDGWDCSPICERLAVPPETELTIAPFGPHPTFDSRQEASDHDELVEYLNDFEGDSNLVSTAPHGGWIEYGTETQSRLVAEQLGAVDWSCVGFNSGGGAYDRWHITSTELSPRSFPKLGELARRKFQYAVSFHGFGEPGVAVGGGASHDLKRRVRDAIERATDGVYDVFIPADNSPYAGSTAENYVNWLTTQGEGIQIEQHIDVRRDHGAAVAEAVVDVFEDI